MENLGDGLIDGFYKGYFLRNLRLDCKVEFYSSYNLFWIDF